MSQQRPKAWGGPGWGSPRWKQVQSLGTRQITCVWGVGGLRLEPRELEEQQEMETGEAGCHTKNSGCYPKGKGSEQTGDMTRLVF